MARQINPPDVHTIEDAKERLEQERQRVQARISRTKILWEVLRSLWTVQLLGIFGVILLVVSVVIYFVEPNISSYSDALWLCFAAITTIGFGDVVAVTHLGRWCLVLLSIIGIAITAIVTSVLVAFHHQITEARANRSALLLLDRLEHLPELSKEELTELAEAIRKLRP